MPSIAVHVLHRLARRALAQIVEAAHHREAPPRGIQRKPDIAEIRVRHVLQLRQLPGRPDAAPSGRSA